MIKEVILNKVSRRADKSVAYTFTTSLEQTSQQLAEWDSVMSQSGFIYFKTSGNLTQQEVEEIEKTNIEVQGKTKSQRLRNVLYVYSEQNELDFNNFYADEMEKIIQHYKDKLK